MTNWCSWLDVQNGANHGAANEFEPKRRFITTPRDLATYVHFDQLYQAYFNATLILLNLGSPVSYGFPENNYPDQETSHREAFATFGAAHILSLVSEVATRCLKAVRRQKFNIHRRARPEVLGGRLTLVASESSEQLKRSQQAFTTLCGEIPNPLLDAINTHNSNNNKSAETIIKCGDCKFEPAKNKNFLLPMAFAEGSPMHPAYGAGHATVAGGFVTMLKAFFEMFDDDGNERMLRFGGGRNPDGDYIGFIPEYDTNYKCESSKSKTKHDT